MLFTDAPDDEEEDFSPAASSKLSSLFGGKADKSSSLKYVAPKQPRSDSADSTGGSGAKNNSLTPSGQQTLVQTMAIMMAAPVHAYLYVNGVAQSQGRAMSCILGNCPEKNFQLLLYRSKQDHLTRARIHQQFLFTIQANNYGSFIDDQHRDWSIMLEAGQYVDFITQIGICRALVGTASGGVVATQTVVVGEGPLLQEGDQAQVSFSAWSITNGKKGEQIDEGKTGHRVKLKDGMGGWEAKLLGTQKCSRLLVFTPQPKDSGGLIMYDLTVERVRQKGGDQSGRNTPQVDNQQALKEESSVASGNFESLPEDTKEHAKTDVGSSSKASLVSRMAREEISRRKNARHNSGSMSGSTEELAATPAIRSRAQSARSETSRPEPAPRPPHLSPHPQQLVVYQQAPWQHAGIVGSGYSTMPVSGAVGSHAVAPQHAAPVSDPTLSLLFSETRSQNTELKISVSKMSDKIDSLMSKIEKLEQQQQQSGGSFGHSSIVPSRMIHQYKELPLHYAAVNSDPHGLLAQISTIVSENDEMKSKLEDKEKTIALLNTSVTQLLQKNQKLLEDKTDMLVARQQEAQDAVSSVSVAEVQSLRDEKAAITAQLSVAQHQCTSLQDELSQAKKSVETQQRDIQDLKTQIQVEHARRLQVDAPHQEQLLKEKGKLEEKIQALQREKNNMKSILDTTVESKQTLQQELSGMVNKKIAAEEHLQIIQTECERLKKQTEATESRLRSLTQQMEEEKARTERSGELHSESQHKETLELQQSRISQLEQEVLQLRSHCSKVEEEKAQNISKHEIQLKKLVAEKTLAEEVARSLEKAARNQSSNNSSSPEEVVERVKKVMNTVYRTLKAQFISEKMYLGSEVLYTLLSVIRDTTLQLIDDLNRTNSTAESSPSAQGLMGTELERASVIKEKSNPNNPVKPSGTLDQVKSNKKYVINQKMDNEESNVWRQRKMSIKKKSLRLLRIQDWRPRPPTPPLFGDDQEDDDDWLS
ncbi:FK506-binding protein 15 isoform X3 [Procambarus clarkii]|uniref:FK506-binding protein 15 isoform X3 n=1 Tax=Procambarus clarkii TaxID=6728 RepID=UPI0037424967